MAKKYESEIDPDEFIRSFREESSSLSSLKMKPQVEISPEKSADMPPNGNIDSPKPENDEISPDREQQFMDLFVRNMTYMTPEDKFHPTEIAPEFIWKIRRILFSGKRGRVCSIKAYINNVLAVHFKEYADIINTKL